MNMDFAKCKVNVNNCPPDLLPYVVARYFQPEGQPGQLWFWGAWDDPENAAAAAAEVGGMVLERINTL